MSIPTQAQLFEEVDRQFAAAHPELPLSFAYEMRNVLSHGYFKVDLGIVWKTIERDLPVLLQQVKVISKLLDGSA